VAEARSWNGRAFIEQRIGDYQGLLGSAARAEALAAAAGGSAEARIQRVTALIRTSDGWFRLGDADQQMASAERALELAETLGEAAPRERALSLKLVAMGHQTAGRFEEARRRKAEALEIFRGMGDRQSMGMMLNSLGETLRLQGDYAAALEKYLEALTLAEETGNRPERILCLSNIAGARIGLGEFAAAEADARRAIELAGEAGYHVLPEAHRFLSEALLGQERLEEAEAAALHALSLSRDENPDHLGHAWRALGRVAGRLGRPVQAGERAMAAGDCFGRAVEVFERSGMEPERARTLRDWGALEREAGDAGLGEAMWDEAREAFRRLGMGPELERMEKEPGWTS
jgi:tetratricopeptide (TPR) repeat protein